MLGKINKDIIYLIFIIFNVIFGISGLLVIAGGIYLIVKVKFNQYIVIVIGLGIIIAAIFILGLFSKKKRNILVIYLSLISVIFILEVALDLVIKFHEDTNNFIKNNIKDIVEVTEEEKDEIINVSLIIIAIAAGCSFFCLAFAFMYYLKLKEKYSSKLIEDSKKGDEFMRGLDYTNLNPDISAI